MVSLMAPAVLGASLCLPVAAVAQVVPATPTAAPDAASPALPPLPLDAALALARRHAPAIRAATTRATAEAGVADASRAWRSPTVDLSVENLGPQDLDHDGFVWFTQPLDIGARRSTRIAAARSSRDFLARQVDAERRVVDLDLVDTYLGVVRARQASELLAAHERALDEVVRLVERRVGEGVAAEGDLRKLEAERGRTRIARVRLELDQHQHALKLGFLTGLTDGSIGERVRMPPAPPVVVADIEAAVERRADVLAAAARVDERRTAAAAERALGSTAIAAMGGYKRTAGFNTGTAGVSIDLPIGLRNAPARLRAEADIEAATLGLEQARALARLDIEQALLAARVLTTQAARVTDDLVTPAEIAQRAARAAFREGTGDALAVVDADRVHLDTRREALALQLDAAAASIRARLALGEDPVP
ncbi:type I secretion outer membrane protein, TolC family [Luteitalea pratensis]|uniref:Type I secretion outer membrane protein, TolC family n=1 Tax=Luteitalea pratensis TaxID=1855912 RepID=A0A143PGD2_LUTPR|nr:TolC family protein [Luteitalea pratensis]AMY07128.1 type I secretion outer membrane protein, TolC family [Luteitalea pratensis]